MPPQKKQTARKTTGLHLALTAAVGGATRAAPAASRQKCKFKRVQHRPTTTLSNGNGQNGSCSKPAPVKSILKRPSNITLPTSPGSSDLVSRHSVTAAMLSPIRFDIPPLAGSPLTNGIASTPGALIRRRPAVGVLDKSIFVCTRFATWLETQKCVQDETLLSAVERDGSDLLCLARATIMFDNALRGRASPSSSGPTRPLIEHARTLRIFAEFLKSRISEGTLSEELETAVLRDGEALLRLAISCLEFDQVVRGSGSVQAK